MDDLLYTDGVSEANNEGGEEFGEERIPSLVAETSHGNAAEAGKQILDAVTRFCSGNFHDDVTLVVVACRAARAACPV
jgi:phosphoserine phosphatase RsbU/P